MSGVIWNNGSPRACRCTCHNPIPPSTLRLRLALLHARDVILREHRDHYLPEPGCQACATGVPRIPTSPWPISEPGARP